MNILCGSVLLFVYECENSFRLKVDLHFFLSLFVNRKLFSFRVYFLCFYFERKQCSHVGLFYRSLICLWLKKNKIIETLTFQNDSLI